MFSSLAPAAQQEAAEQLLMAMYPEHVVSSMTEEQRRTQIETQRQILSSHSSRQAFNREELAYRAALSRGESVSSFDTGGLVELFEGASGAITPGMLERPPTSVDGSVWSMSGVFTVPDIDAYSQIVPDANVFLDGMQSILEDSVEDSDRLRAANLIDDEVFQSRARDKGQELKRYIQENMGHANPELQAKTLELGARVINRAYFGQGSRLGMPTEDASTTEARERSLEP